MTDEIEQLSPGTLLIGEVHPAAHSAMGFIKAFITNNIRETMIMLESLASCALSGDRLAEICHETLRRVISGEMVSDRYLLGLCWTVREMHHFEVVTEKKTVRIRKPRKKKNEKVESRRKVKS